MNWKPQVLVDGEWGSNALVFATEEEALYWGRDRMCRWILVMDYRAVQTPDPANYRINVETGAMSRIEEVSS